jgi:hypothetical protein
MVPAVHVRFQKLRSALGKVLGIDTCYGQKAVPGVQTAGHQRALRQLCTAGNSTQGGIVRAALEHAAGNQLCCLQHYRLILKHVAVREARATFCPSTAKRHSKRLNTHCSLLASLHPIYYPALPMLPAARSTRGTACCIIWLPRYLMSGLRLCYTASERVSPQEQPALQVPKVIVQRKRSAAVNAGGL